MCDLVLRVFILSLFFFFFSSRRRHTRCSRDWSSDVCSSDLSQDAPSTAYRRMRAALDSAFAGARPLIYAAGHDHALQVITGTSARYELVSGAGTFGHLDRVTALDSTRFARSASGFMRVEFLHDGRARLGVTVVDRSGGGVEAFALWLQ